MQNNIIIVIIITMIIMIIIVALVGRMSQHVSRAVNSPCRVVVVNANRYIP